MTDHVLDPKPAQGFDFDRGTAVARQAATSEFWKGICKVALWGLAVAVLLTGLFNGFYRLAVARTLHWPSSLVLPSMQFREADPIVQRLVDGRACTSFGRSDDWQNAYDEEARCSGLWLPLALGDMQQVRRFIEKNRGGVDDLQSVLNLQMRSAAARADWATCTASSWMTLMFLEARDPSPTESGGEDNKSLLLATACEFSLWAFRAPDEHQELLLRLAEGAHLDEDFVGRLSANNHSDQLRAWGRYLLGLKELRQKNFAAAVTQFIDARKLAVGTLRDLCTLSVARAIFWHQKLDKTGKAASRGNAVNQLKALESATQRKSFKTDIQYYQKELGS